MEYPLLAIKPPLYGDFGSFDFLLKLEINFITHVSRNAFHIFDQLIVVLRYHRKSRVHLLTVWLEHQRLWMLRDKVDTFLDTREHARRWSLDTSCTHDLVAERPVVL